MTSPRTFEGGSVTYRYHAFAPQQLRNLVAKLVVDADRKPWKGKARKKAWEAVADRCGVHYVTLQRLTWGSRVSARVLSRVADALTPTPRRQAEGGEKDRERTHALLSRAMLVRITHAEMLAEFAAVRAEERAAICAWLRTWTDMSPARAANRIEDGDHEDHTPAKGEGT